MASIKKAKPRAERVSKREAVRAFEDALIHLVGEISSRLDFIEARIEATQAQMARFETDVRRDVAETREDIDGVWTDVVQIATEFGVGEEAENDNGEAEGEADVEEIDLPVPGFGRKGGDA